MQTEIAQTIYEKVKILPIEEQRKVAEFIETLAKSEEISAKRKTIWEKIDERVKQIPEQVLEKLPVDGAERHRDDHFKQEGLTILL